MISLGLDPSLTNYGWCVLNDMAKGRSRRIASGSHSTTPDMIPVVRFMQFRSMVDDLISKYDPDVIGIESPAYDGPFQVIHHGLLLFSLESIFKHRKDVVFYDPSTLKSLIRGNKNVKGPIHKIDVQKFVSLDMLSPDLLPHDEADAYALSFFATRIFKLLDGKIQREDLSESEKRIFLDKTKKVKTLKGIIQKSTGHVFRENSRIFKFSKVSVGDIKLPDKSEMRLKGI